MFFFLLITFSLLLNDILGITCLMVHRWTLQINLQIIYNVCNEWEASLPLILVERMLHCTWWPNMETLLPFTHLHVTQ